jgi:hypothetical protein
MPSGELTAAERNERDRRRIFVLQLFYLAVLGVLAGLYFHGDLNVRNHYFGHVPPGVFWFGALGAVLISLQGVFEHCKTWDRCWDYWHAARPVVGATVGLVGVLIFQAGILAAGSNPTPNTGSGSLANAPKNITYYLVAFLLGYREATFRRLIQRLTDVLLTPDGQSAPVKPTLSLLNPSSGKVNTSVVILGTGLTGAKSVKFGANTASFTVDSDAQITAVAPTSTVIGPVAVAVTTTAGEATGQQFTYTD